MWKGQTQWEKFHSLCPLFCMYSSDGGRPRKAAMPKLLISVRLERISPRLDKRWSRGHGGAGESRYFRLGWVEAMV